MNPKTKPPYSIPQNAGYLLRLLWNGHKKILLMMSVVALCGAATPLLGMFLPKIVVDLVGAHATVGNVAALLGGYTLALATVYFGRSFCEQTGYYHINALRFELWWKLFEKALDCDYRTIESASGQDAYQKSANVLDRGDGSGTTRMLRAAMQVASSGLVFLLTSSILTAFSPWVIVFLLAMAAVQLLVGSAAARYEHSRQDESATLFHKHWYLNNHAKDPVGGKDIRLYGVAAWFTDAWGAINSQRMRLTAAVSRRYMGTGVTSGALNLLRDGLSYLYIILAVTSGQITLGNAVLFFGAVTGFSGFIGSIVSGINEIIGANLQLCDLRAFFDLTDKPEPEGPAELPDGGPLGIEFRDVCFRYEGEGRNVIDHLNLRIRPGQRLALVGVNGAGKTTLVKLLCGFYEPDSGQILLDGTDIRRFRSNDLFRLFSAVFQDVMILPFTVAENVALHPQARIDRQRVESCLRQAGLWEAIAAAGGLDKPMLKLESEDGIVLSGGQQQKLLLARALYKNAPILVLDEPTAALDPIAESEVYDHYQQMTAGRTALFISHRLASTRFCDEIAFLKDGAIAELGSHTDLLAAEGDYAHMFDVQSHYYRDDEQAKEAV